MSRNRIRGAERLLEMSVVMLLFVLADSYRLLWSCYPDWRLLVNYELTPIVRRDGLVSHREIRLSELARRQGVLRLHVSCEMILPS